MRSTYVKVAVLVAAAMILIFEGVFLYGFFQENYAEEERASQETTSGLTTMDEATAPEDTRPENRASIGTPEGTSFIHRTRPGNTSANSTFINDPLVNDNPDAVLIVTRLFRSDDEREAREIGVWYYARGGKWAIFNQDGSPMSDNVAFNVIALEGAGTIVHRATPANTEAETTYLDNPLTNDAPGAILSVTQNWNPGGAASGTYNDHPVAARYEGGLDRWALSNLDLAAMPEGASFNVAVSPRR